MPSADSSTIGVELRTRKQALNNKSKPHSAEGYANLLQNGMQQVQENVSLLAVNPRTRPATEPPTFFVNFVPPESGHATPNQYEKVSYKQSSSIEEKDNNIKHRSVSSVERPNVLNLDPEKGRHRSNSGDSKWSSPIRKRIARSTALRPQSFLDANIESGSESSGSTFINSENKYINGNGLDSRNEECSTTDCTESEKETEILHEPPKCPVDHKTQGREFINTLIPCHIDKLFELLFSDSKFFGEFHASRKNSNIVKSSWESDPANSGKKVRKISLTITLNNVVGPKTCKLSDTQTMQPESRPGQLYSINTKSVNSGIPYEDSFYVAGHFCLSFVSDNQSRLIVTSQIKYTKSIFGFTKGFIERNTWTGLTEFYTHLEQALKEECAKHETSPEPSTNLLENNTAYINRNQLSRRPTTRKKRPAPPVPKLQPISNNNINTKIRSTINYLITKFTLNQMLILKIILASLIIALIFFHLICFIKLNQLEEIINNAPRNVGQSMLPTSSGGSMEEMTQQKWIELFQAREILHKTESGKWSEAIESALEILKQTELNLESLKLHINKLREIDGSPAI